MANEAMLNNLIQGIQQKDPRLYDALRLIISNLQKLNKGLDDLTASELPEELQAVFVPDMDNVQVDVQPTFIQFSWSRPDNDDVIGYEIRKGDVWETADYILQTGSLIAQINPIASGSHTYLFKALGSGGGESVNAFAVSFVINSPGIVSATTRIVDNNVLIIWTEPTSSFQVKHYKIEKGSTLIGYREGTFTAIFEQVAGTYTYSITAIDIAGNAGPTTSLTAIVSQPPDYILQSQVESDFSGTKTNTYVTGIPTLLANVYSETWAAHFTSRGWSTIQDQINAGYHYYVQPNPDVGIYEEVIDYGAIISSVIVNLDWTINLIVGSGHNITCEIRVSDDNVTWSSWTTATSLFVASVRYLNIKLTFTAIN